jgi:hypothetical protein
MFHNRDQRHGEREAFDDFEVWMRAKLSRHAEVAKAMDYMFISAFNEAIGRQQSQDRRCVFCLPGEPNEGRLRLGARPT